MAQAVKNDVEEYIGKRKCTDKVFAEGFEAGYAGFKRRQRVGTANVTTSRMLNGIKVGKQVKRFGAKERV